MEIVETIEIKAGRGVIWNVLCDIPRWSEWTTTVLRITSLDTPDLRLGSRFRVEQPRLRPAIYQVTDLAEGEGFTWTTGVPGAQFVAGHTLVEGPSSTQVRLSLGIEGPLSWVFSILYSGISRRYLQIEAAGLKTSCEGMVSRQD